MRRLLLAALVGVLACSRSSEPLYIGVAGPWKEAFGRMNKQGIDLAVAHINARGGIKGRPLRLVERDDEGIGSKAAAIAGEFVANRSIIAVVGHVTSGAMMADPGGRFQPARAATGSDVLAAVARLQQLGER